MRRVTDTRHIGVPLFLVLCVVSIIIAVTPLWTAAQTPPATVEATTPPQATDQQAATDTTATTDQGATTDQTGDGTEGTPSDNGTGDGQTATVAPTDPPLTPTDPIVAPTPTIPLDTPTPTPTPALPNTDTLTATSDTAPATLQPGQTRQFTFTYNVTTPRTGTTIHAELRLDDGSPATGWLLQAQAGQGALTGDGPTVDVTESGTLAPGGTFSLTIVAQAPKDVTVPQTVSLYLGSTAASENGEVENGVTGDASVSSVTVEPTPTPVPRQGALAITAASTLSCKASAWSSSGLLAFDCPGFTGSNNQTYTLAVSNLPQDWQYQFSAASGWNPLSTNGKTNGTVATFTTKTTGAVSGFTISIGPSAPNAQLQGGVSITITSTKSNEGPWTMTPSATFCTPSPNITNANGTIAFGTSTWDASTRGYPALDQNLNVALSAGSGCNGFTSSWSVSLSASAMNTKPANNTPIPAGSLWYLGQQASAPPGMTKQITTSVPLDSSQKIATGDASVANSATWALPIELRPPSEAAPGDYFGTITITIANGG